MTFTKEFKDDLDLLRVELGRAIKRGDHESAAQLQENIAVMEAVVYDPKNTPIEGQIRVSPYTFEPEVFYKGEWRRVERRMDLEAIGDKYTIPSSLMVNIFMRKLQDGRVDRR